MFICSVKATTLRFVGILVLSVSILVGMTVFYTADTPASSTIDVKYDGMRTETDRRDFLGTFGYRVTGDAKATVEYTLPKSLDTVLLGYNEIQKQQGFDLGKYTGKTVTRYTYEIENYEGYDGTVYANLVTYRDRIIAADLTAKGEDGGFVKGLSVGN